MICAVRESLENKIIMSDELEQRQREAIYKAYTAIQNWIDRKEREQRKLKRAQWAQETKRLLYRELEKGDRYNKRKEDEDPNV